MSGFFDYNGDGVVNQQDDIDYWDDDYYARTHHIGMYADAFSGRSFDIDDEDEEYDEDEDDFFGSHDYDDDYDDDSDSDDFDDDDF